MRSSLIGSPRAPWVPLEGNVWCDYLSYAIVFIRQVLAIYGVQDRDIAALVNRDRLRRILFWMLDENEFLSPYGIRALSRYHCEHPYVISVQGQEYRVNYLPADSDTGMFGGKDWEPATKPAGLV